MCTFLPHQDAYILLRRTIVRKSEDACSQSKGGYNTQLLDVHHSVNVNKQLYEMNEKRREQLKERTKWGDRIGNSLPIIEESGVIVTI